MSKHKEIDNLKIEASLEIYVQLLYSFYCYVSCGFLLEL